MSLSFVEPHVVPVADIIHMALQRVPRKGNIMGADLLTLQGLVCLLRDTPALMAHAQKIISGYGLATVLDALLADAHIMAEAAMTALPFENPDDDSSCFTDDGSSAELSFDPLLVLPAHPTHPAVSIPSMGL